MALDQTPSMIVSAKWDSTHFTGMFPPMSKPTSTWAGCLRPTLQDQLRRCFYTWHVEVVVVCCEVGARVKVCMHIQIIYTVYIVCMYINIVYSIIYSVCSYSIYIQCMHIIHYKYMLIGSYLYLCIYSKYVSKCMSRYIRTVDTRKTTLNKHFFLHSHLFRLTLIPFQNVEARSKKLC